MTAATPYLLTDADLATQPVDTTSTPEQLQAEILGVIRAAIDAKPRNQQRRIGPSGIGTPCDRRLGYALNQTPPTNVQTGAWKPAIGTAVHDWLETVFYLADITHHPARRWLVEQKVDVGSIDGETIDGSCDLYDLHTRTAVDWKITTVAKIKEYRRNGPGQQYRTQVHLYGRGWATRGLTPRRVAIFFLPRDGELSQAYMWCEDYDEQLAVDALARAGAVATVNHALGPAAPAVLNTADAYCTFCPWLQRDSTNLTHGCPGHPSTHRRTDSQLDGLIPT